MSSNVKGLLKAFLVLSLIVLTTWLLIWHGEPVISAPSTSALANTETQPAAKLPHSNNTQHTQSSLNLPSKPQALTEKDLISKQTPIPHSPINDENNSSPLSIALSTIAAEYQYQNRFAAGTTTLSNTDFHLLNPNHSYEIEFPVGASQKIQATLVLNQYQYVPGDTLSAQLSFSDELKLRSIRFFLSDQGQEILTWPSSTDYDEPSINNKSHAQNPSINFKWSIPNSLNDDWLGEKQFSVSFEDEEGFRSTLTQGIKLSPLTAILTAFSDVNQQGRFIKIHFLLDVKVAGHYRIKANVFDDTNPIAHLNQKFKRLSIGEYQGYLTLDSYALYEADVKQPLKLKQIQVEQMPSLPGDKTFAGKTEISEYQMPILNSNAFSTQPIENIPSLKLL